MYHTGFESYRGWGKESYIIWCTNRGFIMNIANILVHNLMFFSDRASWIDYILITNLMHWLLFIHKILFTCTCFEPQVLIFRRIQLYTFNGTVTLYESSWCPVGTQLEWVNLTQAVYRQVTRNSHREWQYHMLHVYNCILLKMSTWGSKHVEENIILWINNNQCIKLVINI